VLETLMSVKDAVDAAIILITHDLGVIAETADRVLVMYAGRPVEIGTTREVFSQPRMPYTAGLLGSTPSAEGTAAGARLRPITGAPPSLIALPPGCPFNPRCPLATAVCREDEPDLAARGGGPAHLAACHHSDRLAAVDDPTSFFRAEAAAAPAQS
jgi:peptide/nickel transport system ATP-binding protein